jgi:hypothetical protein
MEIEKIERKHSKLIVYYVSKQGKKKIKEIKLTPRLDILFQIASKKIIEKEVKDNDNK